MDEWEYFGHKQFHVFTKFKIFLRRPLFLYMCEIFLEDLEKFSHVQRRQPNSFGTAGILPLNTGSALISIAQLQDCSRIFCGQVDHISSVSLWINIRLSQGCLSS